MSQTQPGDAPPLIVYAEDDDDTRELVRALFVSEGFRVVTSEDAEGLIDAVNRLCELGECPDIILSDVNFFNNSPRSGVKLTGIGAASKINEKFPNLPILFLTAYDDRATRANALAASNSDLISKPFDPSELVERVRLALHFGRRVGYEGRERRRNSINRTGFNRRKSDRPIELPRVVIEAQAAHASAEALSVETARAKGNAEP